MALATSWSTSATQSPLASLTVLFVGWKVFIVAIALLSPGLGYDTCTDLLLADGDGPRSSVGAFVRWDAIYFVGAAERGFKLFEQEWAFGIGVDGLVGGLSRGLSSLLGEDSSSSLLVTAWAGIIYAHLAHYFSVLVLYKLSELTFNASTTISFITAVLHITSPAGIFLSSPNGESGFSFLHFSGLYFYAHSLLVQSGSQSSLRRDVDVVVSGLLIGLATTFRSNGIASGWLHFYDAALTGLAILKGGPSLCAIRRLLALGIGGMLVGMGFVLPQILEYMEYCNGGEARPWCSKSIPSIYSFVQEHYWNVGFLRYWTPGNVPLFLLAAPMLTILTLSSLWALQQTSPESMSSPMMRPVLVRLALPQLALALLALSTYHVQIITRMASGYPLWYWWLALGIVGVGKGKWSVPVKSDVVVIWMVMYTAIQGGLYASFLPPA